MTEPHATPRPRRKARAKRKALFREADLARALKVATRGGVKVGTVRIEPDGSIVLSQAAEDVPTLRPNSWDV